MVRIKIIKWGKPNHCKVINPTLAIILGGHTGIKSPISCSGRATPPSHPPLPMSTISATSSVLAQCRSEQEAVRLLAVLVIGWAQFKVVRDIQRRSQRRSLRSQQASKQGQRYLFIHKKKKKLLPRKKSSSMCGLCSVLGIFSHLNFVSSSLNSTLFSLFHS